MVQGIFDRRISRRLASVEVNGSLFEAYVSNGIDMDFLKSGATCFLREAEKEKRRTPFDLYSVYDGDTLICVDSKEPIRIAKEWVLKKLGGDYSFYSNVRQMLLYAFCRGKGEVAIQVMGTSFVKNREAYLPEIPSIALNDRLEYLIWMKNQGQNPRLLFVVCRNDADCFFANSEKDPYFAILLDEVKDSGIPIEVVRCSVNGEGMTFDSVIPLKQHK